mgnify:CR=1 FL=1
MKRTLLIGLLPLVLAVVILGACRKDPDFDDESDLQTSVSEIVFDTVFTTVGSTTKMFYIKNSSNQPILTSINLGGGNSSNFRVNVDGVPGVAFSDVEIPANDSLFIFVKVTVDPQNSNSPLVIRDSLMFTTNGHQKKVGLTAWGQDAHYIVADKALGGSLNYKIVAGEGVDTTWTNDKPYLIYGYAVIDSTGTLRINPGVKLHFYNGSGMWVYKGGSLKVNGTADEPVVFQGPRLEPEYRELPGQWDRIWINEGAVDNEINHAIIKNGFIGIQAETLDASMGNKLVIRNTEVRNMSGIGLLSRFYRIRSYNSVFSNCAVYGVCLTIGGAYDFRHCTIGNYWSLSTRQTPSLVVTDYYNDLYNGVIYTGDLDTAYFGNCIVYGSLEEEMLFDDYPDAGVFNYFMENCVVRTKLEVADGTHYLGMTANQDPAFTNSGAGDYSLKAISGAIDKGSMNVILTSPYDITFDIKGNSRLINPPPDPGAYDYRP